MHRSTAKTARGGTLPIAIEWLAIGSLLALAIAYACAPVRADGFDPFRDDTWNNSPVVPARDPFDDPTVTSLRMLPANGASKPAPAAPAPAAPAATTLTARPIATPAVATGPVTTPPMSRAIFAPQQTEPLPMPVPNPTATTRITTGPQIGCGTPNERPLGQLTINIQTPRGELPTDQAAACWQQVNATSGPLAAARLWPQQCYAWNATCLAHNPLYFEEINLERYGYGCCNCLQSGVSAAHFFATVPALPYCMAVDCPGECQYVLGHYRPGSCPPWRFHRPPCSAIGGLSEAGVLTGFFFLIP